jgi:hypothetical protein
MTFQTLDDDSVEARLHDAGIRPTAARPIEELEARARQLRHRRRAARAGGLSVGLIAAGAACAVALSPTLRGGLDSGLDRAAQVAGIDRAATDQSCNTGYGYVGDFSDVPDLLYLPATAVAGPPAETSVRMDHSDCAPDPLALVALRSAEGDDAAGGVSIEGPGARNPYATGGEGHFGGQTVVLATGVPGELTYYLIDGDGEDHLVGGFWKDPAGQTWWIETHGLTVGDLTALVNGLDTHGGAVDPKSLPDDLTAWRVAGGIDPADFPAADFADDRGLIQPAQDRWTLRAGYGDGDEPDWTFEVDRGANLIEREAFPGATSLGIEVLGQTRNAVWSEGKLGTLSWELGNGVVASVSGLDSLEEAKRIASSLHRLQADDPALVRAREKAPRDIPEHEK